MSNIKQKELFKIIEAMDLSKEEALEIESALQVSLAANVIFDKDLVYRFSNALVTRPLSSQWQREKTPNDEYLTEKEALTIESALHSAVVSNVLLDKDLGYKVLNALVERPISQQWKNDKLQDEKNTIDAGEFTDYKLEINGVAISEETLEELGIEYDDASGYMDHLEECSNQGTEHPDYISTQALLEKAGTDITILIKRNDSGAQELIMPDSKEFNEVCEKLVLEEGIRVENSNEIKSAMPEEEDESLMGKVAKRP